MRTRYHYTPENALFLEDFLESEQSSQLSVLTTKPIFRDLRYETNQRLNKVIKN
jgi:hypothetical protein